MEYYTYILGAGASYEAIPTIDKLDDDIKYWGNYLQNFLTDLIRNDSARLTKEEQVSVSNLSAGLISLSEMSKKFGTVDTYAKKLFLEGNDIKLEELKKNLSFYFLYKQILDKKVDKRYYAFLASLLEVGEQYVKWPEKVKIISWNYDFQLELALLDFNSNISKLTKILYEYKIFPIKNENPNLIHLNGIAGIFNKSDNKISDLYDRAPHSDFVTFLKSTIPFYGEYHDREELFFTNLIKFAWEKENIYHENLIKEISNIVSQTKALTIVGYSFPFFNRDIDQIIFNSFKNNTIKNKKIYCQNKTDGEALKSQFQIGTAIDIIEIPQVEKFHIPHEF